MVEDSESAYLGGELDLFALAVNWKTYVKQEIADYLTGDVLEVGAGIGGTTVALHDGTARRWVCLEPDANLALRLQTRMSETGKAATADIIAGSICAFAVTPCFDCILYIDVLEHIEDDRGQMESAAQLVRPGGHIVVLSPAHQWLFSNFDRRIGHLRRYTKASLRSLIPSGWIEKKLAYLDSVGIFLSLGNVLALRQTMPTYSQIILWDRICVPIARRCDRVFRGNVGKSILAVWRKG